MLNNFLKVALRNMFRNRLFAAINILGLSASLACCLLLFLFAGRELGFDRHHGKPVYRVTTEIGQLEGELLNLGTSSVPIALWLPQEIPEVTAAGRACGGAYLAQKNLFSYGDKSWYVEDGYIVDSSLFNVLKYAIVAGNPAAPLPHPDAMVLSKEWAGRIFGAEDPVGKLLKVRTDFLTMDLEVTAVYDPDLLDCHLSPGFFVSMAHHHWNGFFNNPQATWIGNNMVFTYVALRPGTDPARVEKTLNGLLQQRGAEEMKAVGITKSMQLQPIGTVHTQTGFLTNTPTTSLTFIRVLIAIGALILILACVNYINLSTAQAGTRALEVGVRKVMGVSSRGLIVQFLGESYLIMLVSLLIGVLLAVLVLPWFNQLIDRPLVVAPDDVVPLLPYLLAFLLLAGLLAGFYPAFYLASFRPAVVLKGRGRDRAGAALLRRGLVVFQFIISIALISGILVINRQVEFIRNKELGFETGTKLVVPLRSQEATSRCSLLREKFSSLAQVSGVAGVRAIPGSRIPNDLLVYREGRSMDDAILIFNNSVDLGYAQVLGMQLAGGSYFTGYNRDSTIEKILINRTAMEALGLKPESAAGEILYFDWQGSRYRYEVVGVVEDIHQQSLHEAIKPMMYSLAPEDSQFPYLLLNADLSQLAQLNDALRSEWQAAGVEPPFESFPLADHLWTQYASDLKTFRLIRYFTLISVIISCMGLYAMSLFMARRRYREIGIRKTFGAGTQRILVMMSADLSLLILLAFLLSVPLTWYSMSRWLETFAYRIQPDAGIFLVAGLVSLMVGWTTIGYQALRAARINPAEVLREE
jgi:putative ABC transport system permease protein